MKKSAFGIACGIAVIFAAVGDAERRPLNASTAPAQVDGAIAGPLAATAALRNPAHGYPFNATPMDFAKQGYKSMTR